MDWGNAGSRRKRRLVNYFRRTLTIEINKSGAEGKAAASYINGFRQLFGPEWKFERRARRPSPDPVNALLSFGYTLLYHNSHSAVETVGLDPFAGFLHTNVYNRSSLGLDLMEEFRPVVDGVALWCCRGGQIHPDDFLMEDDACIMNDRSKKIFIKAFEDRLNGSFSHPFVGKKLTMRQCLIEQARQIGYCVQKAPEPPCFVSMGFR